MKAYVKCGLNIIQIMGLDGLLLWFARSKFVNSICSKGWDDKDYAYYRGIAATYRRILDELKVNPSGKSILEIGSGNSVGAGYFFPGVRRWIGSDMFRNPTTEPRLVVKEKRIVQAAMKDGIHTGDVSFAQEGVRYQGKFSFLTLDITQHNPTLDDSFDIILSNAVLEHAPRNGMKDAFRNMKRYLKKDGMMIHIIDLRDHINIKNPFHFYRYADDGWARRASGTIFYTNRLRVGDYIAICKNLRLPIIHMTKKGSKLPKYIHPELRTKYTNEVLETEYLELVVKNPSS